MESVPGERENPKRTDPVDRLVEALDAFNQVTLDFCAETGTEYVDAARAMRGSEAEEFYYDDVHLNEAGSEVWVKRRSSFPPPR